MTRKAILKSLANIIAESAVEDFDGSALTEATEIEAIGFDSLSVLDLIFDIEQDTGIEMVAKDVLVMRTVGELVTYIAERA